ncbi:RsiV family protein [Dysosmobacter sp.]
MKESLAQLHTQPFAAEREWEVEGIPVLAAAISLPEPVGAGSALTRRIRRYYQLQCRAFLRYCEHWLLPQAAAEYRAALETSRPLPCFRAELGYRVTYNEGGLWSLYTQSRETGPPGRWLLQRRGDTWDLAAGYPVALSSFFPAGHGWKKTLLSAAAEEILRQEAAGIAQYHDTWRQDLRRRFNAQNYYLSQEGLSFFYPMFSIAPAAEGVPVFTLPYAAQGPALPAPQPAPQ